MTRPEPGASETAARLAALGFSPLLAPLMSVAPRSVNIEPVPQAVLVTSGNAIAGLSEAWRALPLLAVGDATAARARAAGFTRVHSAGRDAAALEVLTAALCKPEAGPLLLASGQGHGVELAAGLRARGFRVLRRVAYVTRLAETLPEEVRSALRDGSIRAALFFSPDSARAFVTILQRDIPAANVQGLEALAISPPTEAALAALPWRTVRVAPHPNQDELLKLLQMTDPIPHDPTTLPPHPEVPEPVTAAASHAGEPDVAAPPPEAEASDPLPIRTIEAAEKPAEDTVAVEPASAIAMEAEAPPAPPLIESEIVVTREPPAPPPVPEARPAAASPSYSSRSEPPRSNLPTMVSIGFLLVLGAGIWLGNAQRELQQQVAALAALPGTASSVAVAPVRVAALEARLTVIEKRLDAVEDRAAPAPSAGSQPPAASASPPAPAADNSATVQAQAALAAQVALLEQRLQVSDQRLAALANTQSVAADLEQRVKETEQRQASLADKAAVEAQVAALEQRLKDDEQRLGAQAAKDAVSQRLQLASLALDAGEPIGDLPGAPPALSRYAKAKPPTEAALRLAFPAAASAAEAASRPSADGKTLGERILMHASSLLTIREGDKVVVGAPATTVLRNAQARLDAGDLGGAVAALDGLDSAAAKAIAAWRGEAAALLDARSALAQMARS